MKNTNVYLRKIQVCVCIICLLVLLLNSCKNKYDKQFYGTYAYFDSSRFRSSGISFYEDARYAFYSSTCFGFTRDSGNFILTNDSISFQSFQLSSHDCSSQRTGNLSKLKFLYRSDTILYIRQVAPFNKPSFNDTTIVGLKKHL